MHKPGTSPPTPLSPSVRVVSSDDDRIAEEFEQLLRRGKLVGDLQDRFAATLAWAEGQAVTPLHLKQIEVAARSVLRGYLAEGNLPVKSPHEEIIKELYVTHDGAGHVTIELPSEVRQCLMLVPRSTISF